MFSILWRYPSTRSPSKWWQSPIPRDDNGDIVIVKEIHNEYAACVYGKIKHEWPYYKQIVAQNQFPHLYACCDSSIDDCHHVLTPEGEDLCHCQRWKQLWDQDVFENYRFWHLWDRPEEEWVGAVKCLADRVMDTFEREDNGQSPLQPVLAFDPPPDNIDFDDFHPYPLSFRDALETPDRPRLGEDFTSVVSTNRNFGFESFEIARRNIPAAEALRNRNARSGHAGPAIGGSGLNSTASGVTATGITTNNVIAGVTTNGVTTNNVTANGSAANDAANDLTTNGVTAIDFATNGVTTNGVTANGVTANGVATNGFAANGVTNGFTANGVTTNGAIANGFATHDVTTNGVAVNGVATNSITTNDVTANELATNDVVENGVPTNGGTTNGVTANGVTTNGVNANGFATNGTTTNGHGVITNGVTANGFAVDDGTGSHEFDDGVLEGISFDDAEPDEFDSDDSVSMTYDS